MQGRTAELAIGASTLRNQGAKGVVKKARELLKRVDLKRYSCKSHARFRAQLDRDTLWVRRNLPRGARHWGTARKALNIFLRDARYNSYLTKHFRLSHVEPWLELPLDSYTARGLRKEQEGVGLPRWKGVKYLNDKDNRCYQEVAAQVAKRRRTEPIHLDIIYWRRYPIVDES